MERELKLPRNIEKTRIIGRINDYFLCRICKELSNPYPIVCKECGGLFCLSCSENLTIMGECSLCKGSFIPERIPCHLRSILEKIEIRSEFSEQIWRYKDLRMIKVIGKEVG